MTRYQKALGYYPEEIVTPKGKLLGKDIMIIDCCPFYLDAGMDDLDEATKVGEFGNITGCRGITCVECWGKDAE